VDSHEAEIARRSEVGGRIVDEHGRRGLQVVAGQQHFEDSLIRLGHPLDARDNATIEMPEERVPGPP